MIRICSLALLGLLASVDATAAEDSFARAAARLAPNASAVTSCADTKGAGRYRTIVFTRGFEHVSSEVYLQWLESDQDGPRVLKSVRVGELSSGFWSVGEPVLLSRKTCAVQLTANHTYSSESARFVLRPAGLGKYAIRRVADR